MTELRPGWRVWRFDQMAANINERVDNPSEAGVDHYVGLEHLDPDSLKIRRWGSPSDVEATKLRFYPGDIIFGRRRAYQRKLGVADFEGICSAHAMVLRAKPDVVLPEFLPFFMQSDLFMERALEISVGSLSPTINWKTLAAQEFALPPLDEQWKLAGLFDGLDSQIWSLNAALATAQKTQLALSACLTKLEHWDERNANSAQLPADWTVRPIGEVCTLSGGYGFTPRDWSESGIPIIRIQNLNGSKDFNYFSSEPQADWIVNPGELLFAWAGMPGVSFGPCIWPGPVGVLNQHIYRVKPRFGISTLWLYHVLKLLTPWIERRAHGFKKSLLHIRRVELTDRLVPIPPLHVQKTIEHTLRQFEASIEHLQGRLAQSRFQKTVALRTCLDDE